MKLLEYEVEYSNEIVGEDDLAANRGFKNTRSHCIKYIPHSLGHSFSLSPHCHNCHKCNVVTCWHNRKSISEAEEPKKYNKTEIIAREISKGEYFSKKGGTSVSFATKLRGLMDELDLSQAQVVALTGIGKTSISQYLSGKNEPHKERQKEIALALGVQENFFQERLPVAEIQADENINLPVNVVAKLMRKSPKFVQQGLQQGRFPWGYAVKLNRWDYWISAVKFSEATGIKVPYRGEANEQV